MAFDSGTMSFRRFAVIGSAPGTPDEKTLERFERHALREREHEASAEIEWGWSGGRHVLDASFAFQHNVFNDCFHVAMRVDTNKVPPSLKKAWQMMEEEAAASQNPSGHASKRQKREAREIASRKADDEVRSGRFRRSRLVPVLWDLPNAMLYGSASTTTSERLAELMERTFKLEIQPLGAGRLAQRQLESHGKRRDYEDLSPTRFVPGPAGDSQAPEYPWTARGDAAKDFLGNEFILWLWHQAEHKSGAVQTRGATVGVLFDRAIDLDCAFAATGRDSLRGEVPTRTPEAMDALRSGKVPRKAGLIVDRKGQQFSFTLNAESFAVASLTLPGIEADSERTLFEERITLLRDFTALLDELYATFLAVRCAAGWENTVASMRRWIMTAPRPATAVA